MEHLRRNLSGGVQAYPADAITLITYMYMYIYTKEITLDPKFDVESNGMVYLSSSLSLGRDITHLLQKWTFLSDRLMQLDFDHVLIFSKYEIMYLTHTLK